MDEIADLLFKPVLRLILAILRVLFFLAYEVCIQGIGWRFGWIPWRAITFGMFPKEGFGEVEKAHWVTGMVVEITGLIVLGAIIWFVERQVNG